MKKPYIICHMMMSVDGRIDCGMTVKISGSGEYYETLDELCVPTTLSGRVTARLEMAEEGIFEPENAEVIGQSGFSKKRGSVGYQVVVDSKGTLLWPDDKESELPLIVIVSERATKEYLGYLDSRGISWIVSGKESIDLAKASEVLFEEFGVERMAIVGGGTINGGFLGAGLIDEVSILIGPGIDGRRGMVSVFDGLPVEREPVQLRLRAVKSFDDGAVWLRYVLK